MRASIIHQIDIVLVVGDGEEEVVKISCIIVCVVTYILAVALGYRVPWWIKGAGGHRWAQANVFKLLKYTGGEFIFMFVVIEQIFIWNIAWSWGIELNCKVATEFLLIEHENVLRLSSLIE